MASETVFCSSCGITLRPFMPVCPRCGTQRVATPPLASKASDSPDDILELDSPAPTNSSNTENPLIPKTDAPAANTNVIPLQAIHQPETTFDQSEFAPIQNVVIMSPNEVERRFPIFTPAQWTLLIVGGLLLILALVIAWLLWRQEQREQAGPPPSVTQMQPVPSLTPTLPPGATPAPGDDQALAEAVKTALLAYNPLHFSHYQFEVKDGVVTLNGVTDHQPEKDGAENVVRLLNGVKSVVNNLKVKPESATASVPLNLAEAKLLDDAMRRQASENQPLTAGPSAAPTPDPQREAERLRREQLAAKQREEETAIRKAAEEKLRREAEEYEKRQEELRRAEAERRARAEQARLEASVLRSGTVAWSGIVDGQDEIIISGSSASVRHLNGKPPREVRASFSAPLPRSPIEVKLLWNNARGAITIVQQPSAANGYTTILRLDDSNKGGEARYEFTLRWMLLN